MRVIFCSPRLLSRGWTRGKGGLHLSTETGRCCLLQKVAFVTYLSQTFPLLQNWSVTLTGAKPLDELRISTLARPFLFVVDGHRKFFRKFDPASCTKCHLASQPHLNSLSLHVVEFSEYCSLLQTVMWSDLYFVICSSNSEIFNFLLVPAVIVLWPASEPNQRA